MNEKAQGQRGKNGPEAVGKQYAPLKEIEESAVDVLPSGTLALRVDWGRLPEGTWVLPMSVGFPVEAGTRIFASVGEARVPGDLSAGTFIGSATMRVENVATPERGRADVQLFVDWGSPVVCVVDYLFVPAP